DPAANDRAATVSSGTSPAETRESPAETREKPAAGTIERQAARGNDKPAPSSNSGSSSDTMRAAQTSEQSPARSEQQASREQAASTSEARKRQRSASRERRRARAERDYAVRRHEPRWQTPEYRFARTRDDQDGGREFIDDRGVRHIVLPRRSSERSDGTMAFDAPARSRRFFFFSPFGPGGEARA